MYFWQAFLRPRSASDHTDLLPLGLYRQIDHADYDYRYTFTNPSPDTVVHSEDRVIAIMRTKAWNQDTAV